MEQDGAVNASAPPIVKAHFDVRGKVFVVTGGSQGLGKVVTSSPIISFHFFIHFVPSFVNVQDD